MLDVTAYLTHDMHVRVTGALADNTTTPYYCLLLCVNATLEDGREVCICARSVQDYVTDMAPQDALDGLLTDACCVVGVARYHSAQVQTQDALRRWLAQENSVSVTAP